MSCTKNTTGRFTFRSTDGQSAIEQAVIVIVAAQFSGRPHRLVRKNPVKPEVRFNLSRELSSAEWTYEFTFEAE